MTSHIRDIYIVGLRNAHAMETQASQLIERQIARTDDYPELKARLTQHLGETHEQSQRLEDCLDECGEGSSTLKDTAQAAMGNMMAMAHTLADDEIIKNMLANNAFENFEIAAYTSLLSISDKAGAPRARELLQKSLNEEQQMADWVRDHVGSVTEQYIAVQGRGEPALSGSPAMSS